MTDPTPPAPRQDSNTLPCPTCGYDLRGLPDLACPECGKQTTLAEIAAARGTPFPVKMTGVVTHMVGCTIVAAIAMSGGSPTVVHPFPLVLLIPAFTIGSMASGVFSAAVLSFGGGLMWTNSRRVPLGWTVFWLLMTCGSGLYFMFGWTYGLQYQGETYVHSVAALNLMLVLVGTGLWLRNRRSPTFPNHWCFQTLGAAWLCSYAFPYLGELP